MVQWRKTRNAYRILARKHLENCPSERLRSWENKIWLTVSVFIPVSVNSPSFTWNMFIHQTVMILYLEYFYIQEGPVTTSHPKTVCCQHELPYKNTTDTQDQH